MPLCDVTGCRNEGAQVTVELQTDPPLDGGILSKKIRLCEKHLTSPTAGVACFEGTPVRLVLVKE